MGIFGLQLAENSKKMVVYCSIMPTINLEAKVGLRQPPHKQFLGEHKD